MGQIKLHVQLLQMTDNAVELVYAACRQCYSSEFAGDIFCATDVPNDKKEAFVRKIVASGHESPLEHVNFTFAVKGISRALSHQLVRHRIASYSQQSQRYIKETEFDYVIPPTVSSDPELKTEFETLMKNIQQSYNLMIDRFKSKGLKGEKANQDARFVLPQAAETKIVITMNARSLLHFFKARCCQRAQWEIRQLGEAMLVICREKLPSIFLNAGAKCVALDYCPEGEQFSCGRYPVKAD